MGLESKQSPKFEKGAPIVVAKVGAPFGLKGQLKLWSFTDPADNILSYKSWFIQLNRAPWKESKDFKISSLGDGFVIKFESHHTREEASLLTNALLGVSRSEFPEPDSGEYYWADLQGARVINEKGLQLGVVDYVLQTPANEVLVLKDTADAKQKLIPFIDTYINNVDLSKKTIEVLWDSSW